MAIHAFRFGLCSSLSISSLLLQTKTTNSHPVWLFTNKSNATGNDSTHTGSCMFNATWLSDVKFT